MTKKAKDNEEELLQTEETVAEEPTEDAKPEEKKKKKKEKTEEADQKDAALAQALAELDKTKDILMRTAAEYDNFRRRSQREKDALYADSKVDVLTKLLPVLDNFERAAQAQTDFEQFRKGVDMIYTQLLETVRTLGTESFGDEGDAFDPNIHNAVMHIEDESLGENVVAQVFSKGYRLGERVLRPASVKVAN